MSTSHVSTDTITIAEISIKNNLKKIKTDLLQNHKKTLVVTGLRDDINQTDLPNYFLGSVQVIIKQCQTSPFKYAFILHGTAEQLKHKFSRSIDYIRLGPECCVKYVDYSSFLPADHQSYDKQTIAVTNITENVSEDDLHRLFPNSRISNYCPARTIHRKSASSKILWRYAFLHYKNVQEAANELQIKRETIKRYEQELQSMKYLFEIILKEKQIQNDQLQHERQFIHNGHEKPTNQLNSDILQKEMADNEIHQLLNSYTQQNYNRSIQMKKQE
ncbi:unnamed protein product, partial [Adineta steineri]